MRYIEIYTRQDKRNVKKWSNQIQTLKNNEISDENSILFGEDQSRYIITVSSDNLKNFLKISEKNNASIFKIGEVIQ